MLRQHKAGAAPRIRVAVPWFGFGAGLRWRQRRRAKALAARQAALRAAISEDISLIAPPPLYRKNMPDA
ncbi:hypothetical protein CLV78_112127 [Aliiruegeria haliotis]|uniref:Uncharacterized protein n=1 Tax=Aliiruegeria haliotis TaxID=1280846 RepID=A0A2T0RHU3_9RHOB|nr:hypothetical protein CLV78_112127 [Aliiruegeria haliotis]